MPEQFTSEQVVALTGITPRQLQWWDERGIVVPAREGRNRLYSMDDLAEIAVVCQLRKKGFSLQRVRKIMRYLQRELGKRLVETVTAGSDYHLLTDGKRIYLENSANQVVDILKNARQPIMAVCLSDAVREVHTEIRMRAASARLSALPRSIRNAAAAMGSNLPRTRGNPISSRPQAQMLAQRRYVAKRRAMS
ncbi:MAG: transcriptional regulator, MerR family [Acidobacteriaceae bacterium]|nr:transcriptional regulator, MerR family [Acidobacteriaceae bacterium]